METLSTVLLKLDLFDFHTLGYDLIPSVTFKMTIDQCAIHCYGKPLLSDLVACLITHTKKLLHN